MDHHQQLLLFVAEVGQEVVEEEAFPCQVDPVDREVGVAYPYLEGLVEVEDHREVEVVGACRVQVAHRQEMAFRQVVGEV